jgi:uncharacterized protein (TIGR02646 family)
VRQVRKRSAPSEAIRSGNWQESRLKLRRDLEQCAPDRRTQRARTAYEDAVIGRVARPALADEQANLCVFCESQLLPDAEPGKHGQPHPASVRIAHWTPINVNPEQALSWDNLFASCAQPESCDIQQGDTDPGIETAASRDWATTQLDFAFGGSVTAREGAPEALSVAIGEGVWNLNHAVLRKARKEAVDAELKNAKARRDEERRPKAEVVEERIAQLTNDPLPYNSAVLQQLRRWRG